MEVKIEIGKHSVMVPMLVADINDDCLLSVNFLRIVNLERIFESDFGTQELVQEIARIEDSSEEIPVFLKEFFERDSINLNNAQKRIFVDFLREFEDVFSENIVARSCIEHCI